MSHGAILKNPSKNSYNRSEADDFQDLTGLSLPKDTALVKFSKNMIHSFYVKLLTDKQTNAHC